MRVMFVCVPVMSGGSFGLGGFSWWIGKALFYRTFWMLPPMVDLNQHSLFPKATASMRSTAWAA